MINENEVKRRYADALKNAKTSANTECCSPGNEIFVEDMITESISEQISFGCVRLEDILKKHIKKGMTVIDFGSGPGHDLFIAAELVGDSGRAIGIDFTDEMINEAKKSASNKGLTNVELIKSNIENINLPDNSADIIISNCVINLATNKESVFKEAYRLLKNGGVLIDADVISSKPLPKEIVNDPKLWCSCIGGALTKEDHEQILQKIGFKNIQVEYTSKEDITFEKTDLGINSAIIWAQKTV
ncbi:MAG: Ubiquinone/menaquinone biosynthesis C-methyltransferase UbiE [Candidatus Heimdallarchaeota archaeon LC_3]|nr:MAG: Ubiquinone/menaquinone biosynthesis C-methyltransferase UbiE [Candidatus Heimdallarchaeota archaeon LC_3]